LFSRVAPHATQQCDGLTLLPLSEGSLFILQLNGK
jgi:hypothetical protein